MSGNQQDSGQQRRGVARAGYRPAVHALGLTAALAALWMLLSGDTDLLLLSLGVLSVVACVVIAIRMDLSDQEGVPIHITLAALNYVPWLVAEIVKANLDVAGRVLSRGPRISPTMFDAPVSQRSDLGQVIYANSITLTPGTVSVDLEPGLIRVHALSREAADGVLEGEMDRRVSVLEGLQE